MKYIASIVLFTMAPCIAVFGQTLDLVPTEGIQLPIHKAHVGHILFTSKYIPTASLKESDFLKSYELTNKSDLFFTAFMGNSITNYMHAIAPEMNAVDLTKHGNYQFTLIVDQHIIYQSNLYPGAPYAAIQDSATTISKPLINNMNEGAWWSQSFWNRFMNNGGDSALTEGPHRMRMEIKPYVKVGSEIRIGALIASGELDMLIARKPIINISRIQLNPIKPYDGLQKSNDAFNHTKIKILKGNIDQGVFKHITSVLVIKNGKLLIEEYFNGATRNTLHDTRSVGKSFTSTMTGIAIEERYLKNESQTLNEFYTLKPYLNYSDSKDSIQIKDLLTMSSSFDGNDEDGDSPGNEENMYPSDDWVKFALNLPIKHTVPRGSWHYFTAGVILLGDILNAVVPNGLERYADEKLFRPLHISKYQWQYTPQHVPNTAGGIQMNALDLAKFGLLYKNKGRWNGKEILPESWVNKSFTIQKSIPNRFDENYGYLFWNKKYLIQGKAYETFYCAGNGGNKIFVFKDQPLVIVVTASAYGAPYAHPQVDKMMTEYILPAVIK